MNIAKVNPGLLGALNDAADRGHIGDRAGRRLPKGVRARPAAAAEQVEPQALLVVRCDAEGALSDDVAAIGGVVHDDEGPIRSVSLPLSGVARLTMLERVHRVRLSRRLRPHLDEVGRLNRIPSYRTAFSSRTGQDVLVGIVDTGIDGLHPAFAGRIVECWDQTWSGVPKDAAYGRLVKAAAATDSDGHGTHVAGIAAGDDGTYPGLAPKARILFVKTDFEDVHIQDGVRYIFRRAKELGLPAVVNLSLGGHGDAHDGTDDMDVLLDFLTGPGRIVVAAAGNEGADAIHVEQRLSAGDLAHVGVRIPAGVQNAILNLWYGGDADLEVSVSSPYGSATAYQATRPADPSESYALASAGNVKVITPGPHPVNGDKQVYVEIRGIGGGGIQPGRWFLHLRCVKGSATVHGWTLDDADRTDVTWTQPTDSHLIGSPGAAGSAITVGAHVSRNAWKTEDGSEWSLRYDIDEPAPFSSPGPLRNGAQKPDVCAAGAMVISSRSRKATYDKDMPIDADHAAMMGTSMACPVITGLVATLLQARPDSTPDDIKGLLRSAADPSYSPKKGWGLVLSDRLT